MDKIKKTGEFLLVYNVLDVSIIYYFNIVQTLFCAISSHFIGSGLVIINLDRIVLLKSSIESVNEKHTFGIICSPKKFYCVNSEKRTGQKTDLLYSIRLFRRFVRKYAVTV